MSIGGSHLLRVMGGLNESNRGGWCVVACGARGTHNGFHGRNSLWVVDRFNDVDWRGVCEMRWWWQRVKAMVAVMVFVPRGSCGGADG